MEGNNAYYTTLEHLLNLYKEQGRKYGLKAQNVSEFEIWKNKVREKLKEISGISKMKSCELSCKLISSTRLNGYRRDKVIIQTEPGVWMPLYILIPEGIKEGEKRACVIAAHGHGGAGKESAAGVTDRKDISERIEKYNYDYGLKFVQQGYVVFCSDARGSGERREAKEQGDSSEAVFSTSCYDLNNAAISIGQSLIGMCTWDLMRLIDFIETLDYCDKASIACCGFSGGGLQALWLSALEDRISCSIISGYYHGFRDSILKTHFCGCNFVPHLWEYADIGDMGALIAPRPLLIENGKQDRLNGERGLVDVNEQVEITRSAFELFNKDENLHFHVFDGGHIWNGEKSISFLDEHLRRNL
jgi:dienelactone hydrolase